MLSPIPYAETLRDYVCNAGQRERSGVQTGGAVQESVLSHIINLNGVTMPDSLSCLVFNKICFNQME